MRIDIDTDVLRKLSNRRPSSRYIYLLLKGLAVDGEAHVHYEDIREYTHYSLKTIIDSLRELQDKYYIENISPHHGRYIILNKEVIR
jgi:hypothetical protein